MKTAIAYYSRHHGNTKKVLDAICETEEVTLIDVAKETEYDLSSFDRIGFASGAYFANFAKQVLTFAENNLPEGKEVFFLNTCGTKQMIYFKEVRSITGRKKCRDLGSYQCLGFDSFGPFKLVGGIAKGHPDVDEIEKAIAFYRSL